MEYLEHVHVCLDSPDKSKFDQTSVPPQKDPKIAAEFDYSIAPTNINHVRLTPALGVNAEAVEAVRARRRTFMVTVFSGEIREAER